MLTYKITTYTIWNISEQCKTACYKSILHSASQWLCPGCSRQACWQHVRRTLIMKMKHHNTFQLSLCDFVEVILRNTLSIFVIKIPKPCAESCLVTLRPLPVICCDACLAMPFYRSFLFTLAKYQIIHIKDAFLCYFAQHSVSCDIHGFLNSVPYKMARINDRRCLFSHLFAVWSYFGQWRRFGGWFLPPTMNVIHSY